MPERIRLSRKKGWKLPDNTVVVSRPSRWGNPFVVGSPYFVVDLQAWMRGQPLSEATWKRFTPQDAVDCYARWLREQIGPSRYSMVEEAKVELRGKNLACWCPPGQACHADYLLALVNGEAAGGQ